MAPISPFRLLLSTFASSSPNLSPRTAKAILATRAVKQPGRYSQGGGAINPLSINNNAIFALFGLLGAGIVLTSIWFFFWARNGGFRWRKGDWDEYKSTVLRRKGPNGTTLSGATKTTELGGGSIIGSQGSFSELVDPEKADAGQSAKNKRKKKPTRQSRHDEDVRAYRQEKPARVGGLNRAADGAYHDYTSSNISSVAGGSPSHRYAGRETIKTVKPSNPVGRDFSFHAGTEAGFSAASDDSHRPLNPPRQHNRHSHGGDPENGSRQPGRQSAAPKRPAGNPHRSRRSSQQPSIPGSFADPLDLNSRYEASEGGSEQVRNSKAYFHPIPSLASSHAGPSRGFRRGVGGGRDILSDSDGY